MLEDNDVAILLRSDSSDHLADAARRLFDDLDVFRVTSIRNGFVGGGFEGGRSLPKKMSMARGRHRRRRSDSRLRAALPRLHVDAEGRTRAEAIANHETLGYVDLGPKQLLPRWHEHARVPSVRGR